MSECIKLCCCLIEQVERNERANELQRVHNTMNRVHTQILKREAEEEFLWQGFHKNMILSDKYLIPKDYAYSAIL